MTQPSNAQLKEQLREQLKAYLQETFMFEFDDQITPSSDLFKLGVIDSFGYVQMISHLKSEYGLVFASQEILSNVLTTFDQIWACVERKLPQAA